jgi:hypothetical protein
MIVLLSTAIRTEILSVETDGVFRSGRLPPGEYRVSVTTMGALDVSLNALPSGLPGEKVTIRPGERATINLGAVK